MKLIVSFFFMLGSLLASGQSAKKLNKRLLAECASEQQKQDDAITLFGKEKAEFDSVKLLVDDKIRFLKNGEKRVLDCFLTYSGFLYLLKELGSDLPPLIHSFKSDEVTVHEFVKPIENTLKTVLVFEKVSGNGKADLEGLSRKEQNKVLSRKVNEYQRYSLSNAIRQEEMKTNRDQLSAFLPRMDSLLRLYELLANDMTSDSWKMQDKLKQIEASFRKKGPGGFSEVYFRVFPEAFPGFLPASEKLLLDTSLVYITLSENSYPAAVEDNEPEIYEWTEDAVTFLGGKEEMNLFITKNLRYPESVEQGIVSGKVYVKFVVSEIGEISGVEVLKGISGCPECSEEAIRLVGSMPNWIPAKHNGKAVRSYVRLPLKFEL